jgi:hypothetical protein
MSPASLKHPFSPAKRSGAEREKRQDTSDHTPAKPRPFNRPFNRHHTPFYSVEPVKRLLTGLDAFERAVKPDARQVPPIPADTSQLFSQSAKIFREIY